MRLKKMISAFCLAVGLTLAVPAIIRNIGYAGYTVDRICSRGLEYR